MAYSSSTTKIGTLVANVSFETTGQFRLGVIGSNGKIALASAGARVDGAIANNPAADRAVEFTIGGVEMVELGGTVSPGDQIKAGSNGVALTHTAGTFVCGVAVEGGVSGDIVPMLIKQTGTES